MGIGRRRTQADRQHNVYADSIAARTNWNSEPAGRITACTGRSDGYAGCVAAHTHRSCVQEVSIAACTDRRCRGVLTQAALQHAPTGEVRMQGLWSIAACTNRRGAAAGSIAAALEWQSDLTNLVTIAFNTSMKKHIKLASRATADVLYNLIFGMNVPL